MDFASVVLGAALAAIVTTLLLGRKIDNQASELEYFKVLTRAYEAERQEQLDRTANLDWEIALFNERNRK